MLHNIIPKISRISVLFSRSSYLATTQKSYYQILHVSKTATQKQIRSQFLKQARELHPDHNSDPKAQEQFKLLKEAYEILRDPQKRYIYDSGITTDGVDENIYTGSREQSSAHRYYNNKWYGFQKSQYEDQRDQYYQTKFNFQEEGAYRKKGWYRAIGLAVLLCGGIGYEVWAGRVSRADVERQHIRNLIEGNQQDKKSKRIQRYIQQRSKAHTVQQ